MSSAWQLNKPDYKPQRNILVIMGCDGKVKIMTLKEKILAILKYEDRVTLVNILMKIPDREIAVSLMALNEHEKQLFFSFLGPIKARRVKEELQYQEKLDIRPDRYIKIVQKFLSYFEPGKKEYRNQSYIRPKRKR